MAASIAAQIYALSGYAASGLLAGADNEAGVDFDEMAAQWMTNATREVINILPKSLLSRCSKVLTDAKLTDGNGYPSGTGGLGAKILGAIRANDTNFSTGHVYQCREISYIDAYKAIDPESVEFATSTDPVFYYEPVTDSTSNQYSCEKVHIRPTDSTAVAKIYVVDYPVFTAGDTDTYDIAAKSIITNFPNEAEHLVILLAAIYAAQYMLAIEEDEDVFGPIIDNLQKRYKQAVDGLQGGKIEAVSKGKGKGLDLSKALAGLKAGK